MKIKKSLPQFTGPSALIAVTGMQVGRIYLAHRGEIRRIGQVEVQTPKYSDREGYFKRAGRGQDLGQGSVYENKKQDTRAKFVNAFGRSLGRRAREHGPAVIHLFCPGYLKALLIEAMPKKNREMVAFSFNGNYLNEHPFVLLEMIRSVARDIGRNRPIKSPDAAKLLELR